MVMLDSADYARTSDQSYPCSHSRTQSVKRTFMFHSCPITVALIEFCTHADLKLTPRSSEITALLIHCAKLHGHSKM